MEITTIAFSQISKKCKDENIKFVYGKGNRKHELQKEYEMLNDWKEKLENYQKHLEIMGEHRNSGKATLF